MNRWTVVLALIVAFMLGGWIGDEARPQPERPVLKFLARVARTGLWLMVLGESPQPQPQYTRTIPDDDHIDHARSL